MKYDIIEWKNSNVEVKITATKEDLDSAKKKVLKEWSKEVKVDGFRPGKVPLDMVEKQVKPEMLAWAINETVLHKALHKVAEEGKYKLIGQIYDVNTEDKEKERIITCKCDIFPIVEVLNENYKTIKIEKPSFDVEDNEVESALIALSKQYATYEDSDVVAEDTIIKIDIVYQDKDGKELDKSKVFLAREDMIEHPSLNDLFIGQKIKFETTYKYDKKTPKLLQYTKKDDTIKPKSMLLTIVEIKKQILPELTLEKVEELFGKKFATLEEFHAEVRKTLENEKKGKVLSETMENIIEQIRTSFDVKISKTLIDQEIKWRLNGVKERFGGEEWFRQYLESIGEENIKKMYEDITSTAGSSLQKYFVLQKYIDLLGLTDKIDQQKPFDMEEKVIEHLTK